MNILYISYDGLTDPLGKSQVLPYIKGLSNKGYAITVISFEKRHKYGKFKEDILMQLASHNIRWKPLRYHVGFSLISTLVNILRGIWVLRKLITKREVKIVHCRSYISAILGLYMKKYHGTKFIFDMRGFWADERREAGMLSPAPLYSLMKYLERQFLLNADSIISLTDSAIMEMKSWAYMSEIQTGICTQIATCCDIQMYNRAYEINLARVVVEEEYKLVYIGSIGPWHSLEELCSFMLYTYAYLPNSSFKLVVNQGGNHLRDFIKNHNLNAARFSIENIPHDEIPSALENFDIAFFFIPPKYSKTASSPTKMGEMLSAGLPIITGHSIGDVDGVIQSNDIGYVVDSFEDKSYKHALDHVILRISTDRLGLSQRCLQVANSHYSLHKAVNEYAKIYAQLIKKR